MNIFRLVLLNFSLILILVRPKLTNGLLKRCFVCRSRGELGSCKDPFTITNVTENLEKGVEIVPCASGWCAKRFENENPQKEEYGIATERSCLLRPPPDNEGRCAYTEIKNRKIYLCYCRGDLCNSTDKFQINFPLVTVSFIVSRLIFKLL